jgi:hypothetical protein
LLTFKVQFFLKPETARAQLPFNTRTRPASFPNQKPPNSSPQGIVIDLDTPFHWTVEGVEQPEVFFCNLDALLPCDSVLYFEGISIAPDPAAQVLLQSLSLSLFQATMRQ